MPQLKKVQAKAKQEEEKDEETEKAEEPKKAAKAKAKKKAAKVEESESSSSGSDSSSSDSSDSEAKPKSKGKAKSKAKAKAKADAAEEKEAAAAEKGAASESSSDEGSAAEEKAEEPKKPAFQPPPRPVFRPHTDYAEITGAEEVMYCPTCGLPPDFCQYGPSWEKCKPWCMENVPHFYPDLFDASLDDAKKKASEAADKAKVKELPGGKKKREASPSVSIKKLTRGGRKCVTSVCGLETFGVKLDNAAKLFKKKFSCGASVVKGENGLPDTVDVQGDFEDEIVDLIADEYKLPRSKVSFLEGGTKKKGKPGGR